MKTVSYVLLIGVLLLGGCRSSQKSSFRAGYDFSGVNKVGIVAVQGTLTSETARDQIAEFFAIELLEQGYAPVGRPQVRASLAGLASESEGESQARFGNLTTNEAAVEVGRMLKIPAVLTISIPHFSDEITITATMIDVEDGSILWLANGSGAGEGGLSGMLGFGGGSQADADDELLGGFMGGGLDGSAGQPLSPAEAKRAQRIIKGMCRSLPSKLFPEF
ncbi:MAG: hypothetical protein JSW66_15820 [Phycisphaerales bacterium]|nr:MAG: hypothetical protein JSW66_15820 [Phycisphaerales bacterium]